MKPNNKHLSALSKLRKIYAAPANTPSSNKTESSLQKTDNLDVSHITPSKLTAPHGTGNQREEKGSDSISQVQPILPPKVVFEVKRNTTTDLIIDESKQKIETHIVPIPSIKDQIQALKATAQEIAHSGSSDEFVTQPLDDFLIKLVSYADRCRQLVTPKELMPRDKQLSSTQKKELRASILPELREVVPKFKNTPALKDNQLVAIPILVDLFSRGQNTIHIGATGSGKSYAFGYMIRFVRKFMPQILSREQQVFLITKPTLVEQATRVVLEEYHNKNVYITSYAQLTTSSLSDMFLKWETVIDEGRPTLKPVWDSLFKPAMFIIDEVQCLKNQSSQQHQVLLEAVQPIREGKEIIKKRPIIWGLSATPYSKPMHTRFAVCALGPSQKTVYGSNKIGAHNFNDWVRAHCQMVRPPVTPDEWSPPAMRRIQQAIEPYTTRFDATAYEHRTIIKQLVIPFASKEEADMYQEAYAEYCRKRDEIDTKPELYGSAAKLVAILQFRKSAELIRAPHMAEKALDAVARGKSVIIACSFRDTLEACRAMLLNAGYPVDEIAEIKGGQSKSGRQRNIDEFQEDKRHIMLMMFSAGGAGLSLHHYKEFNKRPREVYLPPVWNAEEMVQVLGRAHRINSSSTTYQYIMWYAGTIEEDVAEKVKKKCTALKEVVGKREDWTKFFLGEKDAMDVRRGAFKDEELSKEERDEFDDDDDEINTDLPVSIDEADADKPIDPDEEVATELVEELN